MIVPDGPSGTRCASRCTTQERAARSQMGADYSGVMNPDRSLVLVGAVMATVASWGGGLKGACLRGSADAELVAQVGLELGAAQRMTAGRRLRRSACALAEVERGR